MIHQRKYFAVLIIIFLGSLVLGIGTAKAQCASYSESGWTCSYCPDGASICALSYSASECSSNTGLGSGCYSPTYTCTDNSVISLRIDYWNSYTADASCAASGGYCHAYGQTVSGGSCPCTPNCSCAASTCIGSTCSDGCSGSCSGTMTCCKSNGVTCSWNYECCSNLCCGGSPNFCCSIYSLQVSKNGTGLGTVTSNPVGINCGATCSYTYTSNDTVTLSAVASGGSTFAGWSGEGCSGTGTCVVPMTQNRSVTATFNLSMPSAVGYLRTRAPAGTIDLRLISVADALSAGRGMIKVRTAAGTTVAADLVLTSDANASPVRVMTPGGIRSWRKKP